MPFDFYFKYILEAELQQITSDLLILEILKKCI